MEEHVFIKMIIDVAPTLVWIDLLNQIIKKAQENNLSKADVEEAMKHLIVERAQRILDEQASKDTELAEARNQAITIREAMMQDEVEEDLVAKAKRIIKERKENKE